MVSDFQRSTWAKADFSPLPADTQIQFESTAPPEPLANLAILRVEGRAAGSQASTQLEVEVGNYSPTARKITVEVAVGTIELAAVGHLSARRPHHAERRDRRAAAGLAVGRGAVGGRRRRPGRRQRLSLRAARPAAADLRVDDPPDGRAKATSSLFLECALAPTARNVRKPGGADQSSPRVVRVDPAAFDRTAVAAGDLIVLDHPGKLSDETVKLLAGLLHRGRPILYVASELIDATNLKRLCEAAGSGLQMPVEFTPPPAGHVRRDLFLTSVRRDGPPFDVFGDSLTALVGRLRFAGGLSFAPPGYGRGCRRAGRLQRRLGRAWCSASSDAGVLAVINADLAASNLPRTSAFVPLLAELVEQMLDRHRAADSATCGEPLVVHLPAEAGAAGGASAGPSRFRGHRREALATKWDCPRLPPPATANWSTKP